MTVLELRFAYQSLAFNWNCFAPGLGRYAPQEPYDHPWGPNSPGKGAPGGYCGFGAGQPWGGQYALPALEKVGFAKGFKTAGFGKYVGVVCTGTVDFVPERICLAG
jgi:hypothetical protein